MPYGQQPIPHPPKKAGARCTYEVTLLWLPLRPEDPEDPISGLISGLPSEPAASRRGSLETLESFDPRVPIPQATPNPAPKQATSDNLRGYPPERAPEQPRDRPCGGA